MDLNKAMYVAQEAERLLGDMDNGEKYAKAVRVLIDRTRAGLLQNKESFVARKIVIPVERQPGENRRTFGRGVMPSLK